MYALPLGQLVPQYGQRMKERDALRNFFRQDRLELSYQLKGTNQMGQTGFCEDLRFSAVFCENLRFPAVFCENLRSQDTVIPRKSENLQKSAKICELAPFVPFSLSLLIPPDGTLSFFSLWAHTPCIFRGCRFTPLNLGGGVSETPCFTMSFEGRPNLGGECAPHKFRGYELTTHRVPCSFWKHQGKPPPRIYLTLQTLKIPAT